MHRHGVPAFSEVEEIAEIIRTQINPRRDEIARFNSTREFAASSLHHELREPLGRVLESVYTDSHIHAEAPPRKQYRIVAWNIERGKQLAGQLEVFREHPYLKDSDVLLLTETDVGMARSGNVDVARTLAQELRMHYAFVPCYYSLVKGSGTERDVHGENDLGLHGNAILSRYPLTDLRHVSLRNGIDKLAGNEKRLGSQSALTATVEFPNGRVPVACVHLDANSTQRHRADQMRDVLDAMPSSGPALVGGDWNTTTFDSSSAFRAIMGYWRRVFMGPGNVIRNHYLHPYRWFERGLFQLLESRGYDYRNCNHIGEHTIFYDVEDIRAHKGLAEWVPGWCFPFIRWALREHGGGCPLKIDWFASREIECSEPTVIHDVGESRRPPLSDHDAIGVEIKLP
ncbi:MAG: endonuclease/exonuclease/phosphatase family protein [Bryobacteraceae bacterium]